MNKIYKNTENNLINTSVSEKQKMQFLELKTHFVFKDHKKLAEMFKTESIIDHNLMPSADGFNFYKTIHSHNTESQTINFTCIYVPMIDESIYGIEDIKDILEQKQKDDTFVLEIYMSKSDVTPERICTMTVFANYLGMSMYMSIADYTRFKRIQSNLFAVSSIILDLDVYNTIYAESSNEELLADMQAIFDRLGIAPSMFVDSGHGKYLIFSFNNINLSIPSMQKLYRETVKKLIFFFKDFGADSKCSDITRIFRVPGNINPKTGRTAYIIHDWGTETTLSDLAESVGIYKGKTKDDKIKKNQKRTFCLFYKTIVNSRYTKVNQQRDTDFQTLLELRCYDITGYRNIFFHLMSVNCFYLGMDESEIKDYLNKINDSLVHPYDSLDTVIRYAKSNYEIYQDNYENAIKYSNRYIVYLLDKKCVSQTCWL